MEIIVMFQTARLIYHKSRSKKADAIAAVYNHYRQERKQYAVIPCEQWEAALQGLEIEAP